MRKTIAAGHLPGLGLGLQLRRMIVGDLRLQEHDLAGHLLGGAKKPRHRSWLTLEGEQTIKI